MHENCNLNYSSIKQSNPRKGLAKIKIGLEEAPG